MILVKPSAKIIAITNNPLQLIEETGRTCYKSEDKITSESAKPFVEMILKRGHESVIEHASATVRFVVDRGVSHEIVRHRLASYSQESTRYCDYNKGHVTFIIPPWCTDVREGEWGDFYEGLTLESDIWLKAIYHSEMFYKRLREEKGWKPEQARSVLPNSLKTEIVMTANLRQWRLVFKQRTAMAAHPSMREVIIPLLKEFQKIVPIIFDDISTTA